jgi:hypothetical protein
MMELKKTISNLSWDNQDLNHASPDFTSEIFLLAAACMCLKSWFSKPDCWLYELGTQSV